MPGVSRSRFEAERRCVDVDDLGRLVRLYPGQIAQRCPGVGPGLIASICAWVSEHVWSSAGMSPPGGHFGMRRTEGLGRRSGRRSRSLSRG